MENTEEVDFDFFDSPRKNDVEETKRPVKSVSSISPPRESKHGRPSTSKSRIDSQTKRTQNFSDSSSDFLVSDDEKDKPTRSNQRVPRRKGVKSPSQKSREQRKYSSDSSSDDIHRSQLTPKKNGERAPQSRSSSKKVETKKEDKPVSHSQMRYERKYSESSSAYSDSDSDSYRSQEKEHRKRSIEVNIPKAVEAWSSEKHDSKTSMHYKDLQDNTKRHSAEKIRNGERSKEKTLSQKQVYSSDSDSSVGHDKHRRPIDSHSRNNRARSAKGRELKDSSKQERPVSRKQLRSRSSSAHSNNSDITDVSPLASPESSPRQSKTKESHKFKGSRSEDVQYMKQTRSPPRVEPAIKLESDKIDLSLLMKCMADIDKEKQQRLKANSRRVMFAPPAQQRTEKQKGNYSFSMTRSKMIEKENQRLLKQIMSHIAPGSNKLNPGSAGRPVKKKAEPTRSDQAIHLVTPSAVNRQRDQRRMEAENLKMLQRLQQIGPTRGMSRQEQIKDYKKTTTFGTASPLLLSERLDETQLTAERLHMSTRGSPGPGPGPGPGQRSRPSSGKSGVSGTGRRSRPSSAKSNSSMKSNYSVRSNFSVRTNFSGKSAASSRLGSQRSDGRPEWNDRFSYT